MPSVVPAPIPTPAVSCATPSAATLRIETTSKTCPHAAHVGASGTGVPS